MSNLESNDAASKAKIAEQQLAILSLLPRAVARTQHIDELFQWLAAQIIQRFHVQVAEIWSLQADEAGQYTLQLRTLVTGDNSLPQHVITNHHIADFATRLFSEQRSYPPQTINQQFAGYPATTLTRYGLNYITGYYFHSPIALLPPARNASPGTNRAVPFTLAILLFQSEIPSHDMLAILQAVISQALLIAKNKGFLSTELITPNASADGYPYTPAPQQKASLSLWQLIPRRRREDALLMSSNPLSRSVDIPDKQSRRLYSAIDGRKNLGDLSQATGMEALELLRALQNLIMLQRIELYEPTGKPVNIAQFLP